ncbi:peptidoglycan-binding domain-containing protein [Streptomyces sp. NPDC046557]|uniref:peptidoglycan-binding domain-containing protein n=1 Tax=Streptomyces sp. NPDC046557 TaxID=3155372 RepID=UPI0033D4D861
MSAERCPDCGAPGAGCGCAPTAGFDPLRIRPYVSLSETGQAGDTGPSPQPVLGAVARPGAPADVDTDATQLLPPVPPAPDASQDTPAYGTPVAPAAQPWPDHTVPLRAVPAPGPGPGPGPWPGTMNVTAGGEGGGGGPEKRRKLPLLLAGAAAVVALGGVAVAVGVSGGSGSGEATLLDAKPSAPAVGIAPAGPSQGPSSAPAGPSASASASASPSPSASRSASPSASPGASRSSTAPSRTPSPTPSRTSAAPPPPPAAQGPTLRYGDSGPEVKKLQQLLAGQGLFRGRPDGKFGKSTEDAVSEFQWYNDITADPWGVYGPATRKALEG